MIRSSMQHTPQILPGSQLLCINPKHRSEGFPLTCIFSWARWDWDLDCSENSSAAVAVAVAPDYLLITY